MSRILQALNENDSVNNVESLKQELEQAKKGFDPNYEYSDDHSYWTAQKNKAQKIRSIEKQLKAAGENISEAKRTKKLKTKTKPEVTSASTEPKAPTVYKQVKDLLGQIDKRSKQRIIATLKKDLQLAESGHKMSVYEILCELQLEGKKPSKEIDYDDPKWDAMVKRVGQMAKEGPRKTVYDPDKRVYKTVPVNNPKEKGVAETFGPLPKDNQQIRLGRHTVDIERVGLNNNYISFAWNDSKGQEHYEEVPVGDLGSYDDLIKRIKQEISYQERKYTDQGVAEGLNEMDKTQTSPGRDGDIDWTKKQINLGPEHTMKAKDVAKHALKALNKTMKKSHADTSKKKGVAEGYDDEDEGNPVMNAIISRIMRTRPDLLDYDMQKLQAAIRDVALDVGDVDEIGSSDISGWVKRVEQNLSGAVVSEAINPDITNPEFSHQQQIGDYLYVARYWSKGLKISAYDGDKQIGYAELMYHSAPFDDFADPKTTPKRIWLESEWTKVNPKYQRQGIMGTMYAYAKMLGNSVKPSELRSPEAKAAWASWRQSGDAKHLTSNEGVAEAQLDEINWKKAAATGALALGALGGLGASGSAQARVTPGADGQMSPSAAQQMAQQGFQASAEKSGGQAANQNLDTAEKVERGDNGIVVHYGGKEYKGMLVPKDGPTPRGAKMIKINQGQMGERGIGNYTTYLLPNGTAYIYKLASQSANEGVAEGSTDTIYPNAEVIKSKNGRPVGEIYQDENGYWGFFHYGMDSGNDFIDSRKDAIDGLKDFHAETRGHRPDYTIKGVVEGSGPKEKQKTPYRDINSPEYRKAADKQKQQMAKDKAAEPGKKLLAKKGISEVSDTTKQSYKTKAQAQVKELEPHAKKGEYKDIAQRAIDRRTKGLSRLKQES